MFPTAFVAVDFGASCACVLHNIESNLQTRLRVPPSRPARGRGTQTRCTRGLAHFRKGARLVQMECLSRNEDIFQSTSYLEVGGVREIERHRLARY